MEVESEEVRKSEKMRVVGTQKGPANGSARSGEGVQPLEHVP